MRGKASQTGVFGVLVAGGLLVMALTGWWIGSVPSQPRDEPTESEIASEGDRSEVSDPSPDESADQSEPVSEPARAEPVSESTEDDVEATVGAGDLHVGAAADAVDCGALDAEIARLRRQRKEGGGRWRVGGQKRRARSELTRKIKAKSAEKDACERRAAANAASGDPGGEVRCVKGQKKGPWLAMKCAGRMATQKWKTWTHGAHNEVPLLAFLRGEGRGGGRGVVVGPDPEFDVPSYDGDWVWPLEMGTVSSEYGRRRRNFHKGIDIGVEQGEVVLASAPGRVIYADNRLRGYGRTVILQHDRDTTTLYAHNRSLRVSVGDWVTQGQVIALSGNTGNSTGPHLHFELRDGATARNPRSVLHPTPMFPGPE